MVCVSGVCVQLEQAQPQPLQITGTITFVTAVALLAGWPSSGNGILKNRMYCVASTAPTRS